MHIISPTTKENLSQTDFKTGALFLIDKPLHWTSFDVVNKLRYQFKKITGVKKFKVGHAGTLDPLASGLLLVCVGKYTKRIQELQGLPKGYTGTIKLGATTASYDAEQPENEHFPIQHITNELIETTRQQFLGEQTQLPPMFSAVKVDGVALYKKARKGKEIERSPRTINIFEFDVTDIDLPLLHFYIQCSKGTYIRTIAHDFGKALQSGGYLTALRRVSVSHYSINDAWKLPELVEKLEKMHLK